MKASPILQTLPATPQETEEEIASEAARPAAERSLSLVAPRGVPQRARAFSPAHEAVIRIVAVASLGYAFYWLWWRWTSTLNWQAAVFALALVIAETYRVLNATLLTLTCWKLTDNEPPPAPRGRKVDVYITCLDEPLQLIRRTVIGAKAIRYPHQTYLLDDGRRRDVRALARELGVGYVRRRNNEHAKAGNLNHALRVTRGEFILQLDADHVPLPHIVDRLLGYFSDERVAFVQSPQDFYNTDSFTHIVNDEGHRMWEENRIFFSLIQPGKDSWGAAFFCGSCGMFRRAALEQIGGFSTISVTEDMETSIVLHGRGWRSRYHRETLAYGLSPASATQYHVQRLRWGTGAMQILRHMNPLRYPGLRPGQRLQYFTSCIDYLDGLQKAVFYLSPIVFFLTGWLPVNVADSAFLIRLVPYMALTLLSFELLSRGTGWLIHSERFGMTRFFTYILALAGFFRTKPVKFAVTPKTVTDVPVRTYAPQLALVVLSLGSLAWAAVAASRGWIHYGHGLSSAAIWVNGAWLLWNLYFAASVVRQSIQSRQQRHDYRFVESLPIELEVLTADGAVTRTAAMTHDLNPAGLSFRAPYRLEPGTRISIPLRLVTGTHVVDAEIVRVDKRATRLGDAYVHGARFADVAIATRDAIEVHCTQHSVPLWRKRYRESVPLFAHAMERLSDLRVSRRRRVHLPVMVRMCEPDESQCELGLGLLEEMSDSGARLMLEQPLPPDAVVSWEVPGTSVRGRGRVVFNRAFESISNVRFAIGVRCERELSLTPIEALGPAAGSARVLHA